MDKINLKELSGYQVDENGLRDFERPYFVPSLLAVGITIAGFVLMIGEMESAHFHQDAEISLLNRFWFYFERTTHAAGVSLGICRYLPAVLFVGGLVLFLAIMVRMALATPLSRVSNKKMEKYWNANPDPGCTEVIYVDRFSKTYFRRIFARRGRGSNIR